MSASIDTNATGVKASKLELTFNEVVAERASGATGGLESIVIVSPRTGLPKVQWHRQSISIEPRGGFKPNTAYRITLLPGLADLRGNVSKASQSYVFSTGSSIPRFGILGRVFDWQANTIAPIAIVEAVARAGTADSSIYLAVTDSLGQFELGPLDSGRYLVRTWIDTDRNRERGVVEKWDTTTVVVTDHRPSIELLAAQRDTAPPGVQRVEALDSVWARVELDKPFDTRATIRSTMVDIRGAADSSVVQVEAVMLEEQALVLRQRADTTQRPAAAAAVATPEIPSTKPPAARPSVPPPKTVLFVRVNPLTPLKAGQRYTITVRAIPNLLGRSGSASGAFDGPRPPARPPA